jgi:hypothetical protein
MLEFSMPKYWNVPNKDLYGKIVPIGTNDPAGFEFSRKSQEEVGSLANSAGFRFGRFEIECFKDRIGLQRETTWHAACLRPKL